MNELSPIRLSNVDIAIGDQLIVVSHASPKEQPATVSSAVKPMRFWDRIIAYITSVCSKYWDVCRDWIKKVRSNGRDL